MRASMVTIRKRESEGGTVYEIEDFASYVAALRDRNIDAPLVQYSVFISDQTERDLRATCDDLEGQIALFFRIGPSSAIEYKVREG
jgi:hypothetical protein